MSTDNKNFKNFDSVFEGIAKTRQAIQEELNLLKRINDEQKVELNKAKRFNLIMAVVGVLSLIVSIISLVIAIKGVY